MRNIIPLLLAACVLPACTPAGDKAETGETIAREAGTGDRPTGRSGASVARGAEKGPIPADIDEGMKNDASPAPAAAPSNGALPTSIPDQFQGRWALVPADCKGDAAAKGLLTINDSRLTFYESRGTLDRVVANSPANVFTANYGFSGEGQTWEREITFTRTAGKLRRVEQGGEEGPVDLTYSACPTR
ncbi:hypothetical protein GCM10022280_19620 [Sphingomonas swuensis]|uniref:Uncharacterized protein n=1 Tax=Sphingomonas swuensis TaxID=977800 RepID=A0ABP7T1M5_9SPHN